MDLTQREGKYDTPPWAPKTLGVEFSGWVEGLGDGDTGDFKIGDEVFGLAYGGKSTSENTKRWKFIRLQVLMLSTSSRPQKC
jgi:NADPH:quinone reductase-like Zn-dependent oxidoreductase